MAAPWKLSSDSFPLKGLADLISRTARRYEPLASTEEGLGGQQHPRPLWFKRVQDSLSSRILWRSLLILTLMLLLFNFFSIGIRDPLGSANGDATSNEADDVDWSQYAYCQYVTTEPYLCNSLMIFEALQRLESKASRVMMHPNHWRADATTRRGRLLLKARDEYHVALQPIQVQHGEGDPTWGDSFTKLLAFNQTQYKRVLSLDSDATVLQSMDELFLLPSAPVAMPRAYWLTNGSTLSSQLVLVEPSKFEMDRLTEAFQHRGNGDYDMELINDLYAKDCIIIPHRRYDLVTGEFRRSDHRPYLGSSEEIWDPDYHYNEAKFLHFSDWPLPKPWIHSSRHDKEGVAPSCRKNGDGSEDCRDREKWFYIYQDFIERRERVCGAEFLDPKDRSPSVQDTD